MLYANKVVSYVPASTYSDVVYLSIGYHDSTFVTHFLVQYNMYDSYVLPVQYWRIPTEYIVVLLFLFADGLLLFIRASLRAPAAVWP